MGSAVHRVIDRTPGGRVRREGLAAPPPELAALARDLGREIKGEVRFGHGDRALYATDASNYRQTPLGLVVPRTAEDVVRALAICRRHDAPIVPRGGGTSLCGQACNTAVVIDFSKHLNRILSLDPGRRIAVVEPGCVLDSLRDAAEAHRLTFGPDPATHDHNTLGGMIGNDSCGEHSVMAGRTVDNVRSLEILTYDGLRTTVGPTSEDEFRAIVAAGGRRAEIYEALRDFWKTYGALFEAAYPQIPRRVSGYENLDQLAPARGFNVARALVGTEATLVTVLTATLELVPSPPHRSLVVAGFPDIFEAADAVPEVLGFGPMALEGLDDLLIGFMRRKHLHEDDLAMLPAGRGWLICEFGGETPGEATAQASRLADRLRRRGRDARLVCDRAQQQRIWRVREAGLPATAEIPGWPPTHEGWEDAAVRREQLGDYLREFKALLYRYGYDSAVYGHFGDGLVHCRINFDLSSEPGLKTWTAFLNDAADLVVRYGGSISGEHGDGQSKAALLEKMYGPDLMRAQRAFKAIWDPQGRMNPGKVVDPYPVASNLREGPDFRPEPVATVFAYPEDGGSFVHAANRCVGVGACRRLDSKLGVMCPSYMVTREEKHSTRGRARLLFEMVRGETITDGFRSAAVEEALDLCLACKGCKRDCPVQVDMATYKAEFRHRHYAHRFRPRAAYSMGQIRRWAELAAMAPWAANAVFRTPGVSAAAKAVGAIAQGRTIPSFAGRTFQAWFRRRPAQESGRRVLLWPDTFNNFFRPDTAIAATRVLESLGFQVEVPRASLCCGRPLYDWGWLDEAKALWRRTLNILAPQIEAGVPVVGLEPACVSAFRDELVRLFPDDPLAERLSRQTRFFSEFLDDAAAPPPQPTADALVQVHCHHHAVLDVQAEMRVLKAAGLNAEAIASGCCGMAGSFGFEAAKYELSLAAAERVLLPTVRAAPAGVLILANGFSCREQIEQGAGRSTMHTAELLARGLTGGS
jgi:FAD/FMN-containing dehydrogenase/Fe-S oxidoreductase